MVAGERWEWAIQVMGGGHTRLVVSTSVSALLGQFRRALSLCSATRMLEVIRQKFYVF